MLAVTDEVRDLISSRAAEHVIKKAAMRAGMRTLLEDGIDKAAQGLTTLDEVLRVVSRGEATRARGRHRRAGERAPAAPSETRGRRIRRHAPRTRARRRRQPDDRRRW